jgi:hypothetical protein
MSNIYLDLKNANNLMTNPESFNLLSESKFYEFNYCTSILYNKQLNKLNKKYASPEEYLSTEPLYWLNLEHKDLHKHIITVINVPFDDKSEAKSLGAKWDSISKQWYYLGLNKDKFHKWESEEYSPHCSDLILPITDAEPEPDITIIKVTDYVMPTLRPRINDLTKDHLCRSSDCKIIIKNSSYEFCKGCFNRWDRNGKEKSIKPSPKYNHEVFKMSKDCFESDEE